MTPRENSAPDRARHYRVHGLNVASEFVLPGFADGLSATETPDVVVRRGPVPLELGNAVVRGPNWAIDGGRFLLRVPGIARFLIENGASVTMESETEQGGAFAFLMGSVLAILLYQRGHFVLHASAVCANGKAALFCGPSGAGKSTLAAALSLDGHALVNDDVCCVIFNAGGQPFVFPDGKMHRLWADAVAVLGISGAARAKVRPHLAKFYVEPTQAVLDAALQVAAVFMLREQVAALPGGIQRARLADATYLLRRNAYRPWLVEKMGLREPHFAAAANLQKHASVFHLTRPYDLAKLPQVVSWLDEHWRAAAA